MSSTEEWDRIKMHLERGLDDVFMEIMRLGDESAWRSFELQASLRYKQGRAQHAGSDTTWENWDDDDFADNIREELIDCVIYATARALRGMP